MIFFFEGVLKLLSCQVDKKSYLTVDRSFFYSVHKKVFLLSGHYKITFNRPPHLRLRGGCGGASLGRNLT